MEDRRPKVLAVDDEQHIVDFIAVGLTGRGMEVRTAFDGTEALEALDEFRPDVVVLDLMLPGLSGFEVAEKIRARSGVPILVLSARDEVPDKVRGLSLGADDYLTKPFAFEELAARVVALLRRQGAPSGQVLRHADLTLDVASREARRGTRPVELTAKEFDVLRLLMQHPRQVLSKQQIFESAWGYDHMGDSNVVEVYVSYLRRKLNAPGEPDHIKTVRGVGYRLGG
jgi:two-component system response regulator MprA